MAEFGFFHKDQVLDFLNNVHGATNFVQKASLLWLLLFFFKE